MTSTMRPERPEPMQMVVHKASRDCPMVEPHPSTMCGIVQARRRAQAAADEAAAPSATSPSSPFSTP